jgi:uncharacterized protein YbaA (DUF1428 family)
MAYIDGFVVPVPKRKLDAYRQLARKAGKSGASTARSPMSRASPTT